MEIQDRNNIMQLALNLSFDAKNQSTLSELNFMDMIKSKDAVSSLDNTNSAVSDSLKAATSKIKSVDLKEKDLTLVNKEKTSSADKSKNKSQQDKKAKSIDNQTEVADKPSDIEENNSENVPAAYINTASADEETPSYTADDTPTVMDENINAETAAVKVSFNPLNDLPEMLLSATPTVENNIEIETPQILPQPTVIKENHQDTANNNEIVADTTILEPVQNLHINKTANEQPILPQQTEILSSDDLLIRQTQDFDSKLGNEHQFKIDVNVNEAKIAEPIEKNVLQNSFTLTAMLQSADNNETIIDTPILEQNPTTSQPSSDNLQLQPLPITNNTVAFVADTPNAAADLSENNASLINVTRSIDNIADNTPKVINQRLQEVNNDNSLRGMSKEVIEQIKVNITKSAVKGVDTIDIQLKPEDLGKVQVRMYISKDGRLHADIIASRAETADLLQREVSSLSKSFQDAGYNTDEQSFNFSSQNENQAQRQNDEHQFHQFIGETLEQETEPAQANDNLIYDPKVGLNIRV